MVIALHTRQSYAIFVGIFIHLFIEITSTVLNDIETKILKSILSKVDIFIWCA